MKVISIGSDRNLFNRSSAVRKRICEQANLLDELHVIVFSGRSLGLRREKVSSKLWLYPTNSRSRWAYVKDAVKITRNLKLHADLITCQDPFEAGLAGWLSRGRLRVELELQIHTDLFSSYFVRHSMLNRVRVMLAKFLLPRADKIRVVSNRIKDSLIIKLQIPENRVEVRPIFVDVEKIKNAPIITDLHKKYPQFAKIILMASRLTREKNIGLAIESMPEILKEQPRAGLIIAGSGPEESKLKLEIINKELEKSVIFEPWSDDLSSYYKTCDVFLNTSWYEGYGMTLAEARAAGATVISTDVGVAREVGARIVEHNSLDLGQAAVAILK